MGIPYFTTFVYEYLFPNGNRSKLLVNLSKQNVIIDGYSFFYFTYYEIKKEDAYKPKINQIKANKFVYDGLAEKFRTILKQFKDNCANVRVIFDGNTELKKHRRPDPKRDSSIKFDNSRNRLPPLVDEMLKNILRKLDITVQIAPGEADTFIVQMAREDGAYIIARDSDYFLYKQIKGYISFDSLEFSTLQGASYHMKDIFQDMLPEGVALWATTIMYDFISLDILEKDFQMKDAYDAKQFNNWLALSRSDREKSQRLTCLYNLLRYIQRVGYNKAYNKLITLVSEEHKELFEQLIDSYIRLPLPKRKLTFNGNEIHPYLNKMYVDGKLDSDVINILVRRRISNFSNQHNENYCRVLLPMCYILIEWDDLMSNKPKRSSTITIDGRIYNPSQLMSEEHLSSFDQMIDLNKIQENFVLASVNFALRDLLNLDDVHEYYKLWLCMLKLWLQTKTKKSERLEATLLALIISFLKHTLLHTYGETEERSQQNEKPPKQPYLKHSIKKLQSFFSRQQCYNLRTDIERYTQTYVPNIGLVNDEFEMEIQECQQFYKALSMINQFSEEPFYMPPVDFSFNQLTQMLALRINHPRKFLKNISTFCSQNEILVNLIKELYDFLKH